MRRIAIVLASFMLLSGTLCLAQDRYSVSVGGLYSWNTTWKSAGGIDIGGYLPFGKHFQATADAEFHSKQVLAATATLTPKFPLPTGEIFIDGTFHYRFLNKYRTADMVLAASAGYRMDFVSAQVGVDYHRIIDCDGDGNVSEPINLLYRVSFNICRQSSRWNAGGGIANYTPWEYEHSWEPMFFVNGRFDATDNIRVAFRADFKPAGMFHMNANFYGFAFRAGIEYRF